MLKSSLIGRIQVEFLFKPAHAVGTDSHNNDKRITNCRPSIGVLGELKQRQQCLMLRKLGVVGKFELYNEERVWLNLSVVARAKLLSVLAAKLKNIQIIMVIYREFSYSRGIL
ncbi:hypothetical protein V6N13_054770 [Hibiscus sabdariffa]